MIHTADINVKMGVTGVSQFKQAMTQSRAAVKSLDAELKLNEAQYKASGNAEDYLRQKSDLLKKQINEQEKVVKAAEDALETMVKNGVNPADKAFTQMKTNLANAQTQLVNMQTELKNVGDAGKNAADGADKLTKSIEGIGKNVSLSTISSGIQGITSAAKTAVKTVGNLGQAIWGMTTESAALMDEYATMADQYEVDRDLIIRMNSTYVKGQADVNPEDILSAMNKMRRGSVNGVVDLGAGYQVSLSGDTLKDFFDVMKRIDELDNKYQSFDRTSVMERIFGKSFNKVNNFNYDSYMELLESVEVLDEEGVDNLLNFQNALDKMNGTIDTFKQTISADLAPGFERVAGAIETVFASLTEWANSEEGKEALNNFAENIAGIVENFADTDWTALTKKATDAINGVVSALEWFKNNQDTVTSWLTGIAGAFAVFETAKGFLAVAKLVEGFSALGGGAGIASGLGSLGLALGAMTLTVGTAYIIAQNRENIAADMHDAVLDSPEPVKDWVENVTSDILGVSGEQAALDRALAENDSALNGTGTFVVKKASSSTGDMVFDTPVQMIPVTAVTGTGRESLYSRTGSQLSAWDSAFEGVTYDLEDEVEEVTYSVSDLKDCINEGVSVLDYFTAMLRYAGQNVLSASANNITHNNVDTTNIDRLVINGAVDPISMYRQIAQQGLVLKAGYGS